MAATHTDDELIEIARTGSEGEARMARELLAARGVSLPASVEVPAEARGMV